MDAPDFSLDQLEVKLDGESVELPPERRSFRAVRAYLEYLALREQRLLCWITVDGEPINLTQTGVMIEEFRHVEAETMSLEEVPVQLIKGALHQTTALRARLQSVIDVILINDGDAGRELWWTLTTALKEPLLTLSLVPDTICGMENGRAKLIQLRKWQLEQLGSVIEDVDEACSIGDASVLSETLESRVLPWIDQLHASLELWSETVSCRSHAPVCQDDQPFQ